MNTPTSKLIRCPGCNVVVKATRAICPGCGRCLVCGLHRSKEIKDCPNCGVPYCKCCGVCAGCGDVRYSDRSPCTCGHPNDPEKLDELIRYNAVHGAETAPTPIGCVVVMAVLATMILLIIAYFVLWR